MPKRIVICLDGTNNCFGQTDTNVLRIYRLATRAPEQVTYYQPGVGTISPQQLFGRLRQFLARLVDSATAFMLQRHVTAAYRFLIDHYQDGDEIFVFGFSRGAYTARVLCGMLHKVGLLHPGMRDMVPFAFREYRRLHQHRLTARFKRIFSRRVKVRFLGLWDTVSAIGQPWRPKNFPYTARNPDVEIVRQALALDERRVMYVQNLWSQEEARGQSVRQVWFPGVHSDVGGGYPEGQDGLSFIPLAWMLEEAKQAGLMVDAREEAKLLAPGGLEQVVRTHSSAPPNNSMSWAWRLLEYLPVPRWVTDAQGRFMRVWRMHRQRARTVRKGAYVHESVHVRMREEPAYHPPNLPDEHEVVSR